MLAEEELRRIKPPIAACAGALPGDGALAPPAKALARWEPLPIKKFFLYSGPGFGTPPGLLDCYRRKFKVDVWRDERMWELAQNAGALWVHAALERHPLRVRDPNDAEVFILPIDCWTSQKAGACPRAYGDDAAAVARVGASHEARMNAALHAVRTSPWWARRGGRDHALVSLWWGTTRSLGKVGKGRRIRVGCLTRERDSTCVSQLCFDWVQGLAELLAPRAVIVAYDEYFAADWARVVVGVSEWR